MVAEIKIAPKGIVISRSEFCLLRHNCHCSVNLNYRISILVYTSARRPCQPKTVCLCGPSVDRGRDCGAGILPANRSHQCRLEARTTMLNTDLRRYLVVAWVALNPGSWFWGNQADALAR